MTSWWNGIWPRSASRPESDGRISRMSRVSPSTYPTCPTYLSLMRFRLFCLLLLAAPVAAQEVDPALLTVKRIYGSTDFRSESFGPARWFPTGSAYTTLEAAPNGGEGRELVRYD